MPTRLAASTNVLALLYAMYFIAYVDRVNVATAAGAFKAESGLNNTLLGLAASMLLLAIGCAAAVWMHSEAPFVAGAMLVSALAPRLA